MTTNSKSSETSEQLFYKPATSTKITSVIEKSDGLDILFAGEAQAHHYSWFWLCDHGIDNESLDETTLQRKSDTFSIPTTLSAKSVDFDQDQQLLVITWNDRPATTVSAYMLASVIGSTTARHELMPGKDRVLWNEQAPLSELPAVEFANVISDDSALLTLLENIYCFGFSMVEEVPSTEEDTKRLALRVGRVMDTIFGGMWPLSSNLVDHGDTAYTTQYLAPHTDGTYYPDAAGLQLFNCLEFDGKGGESIQVDGFAIAAQMKREDPQAYATLSEINVPGHYIEPGVHLRAERPAFRHNTEGELLQVSFNNYDRAPFKLPDDQVERFHHAYSLFNQHSLNQNNWLKIPLTPGRTLIFDNWRNLHGRMGYVGKREFFGCYHSRVEFESKLRVMQAATTS